MKSIAVLAVCAALISGCASEPSSRSSEDSDGIDPVTMAGIEQSNANADARARATSQSGVDQANAAAAQAATDAANAANATNQ